MKKLFICVLLLNFTYSFAQNSGSNSVEKRDVTHNELSIGALNLVAFGALDLAYERILNEDSSWSTEVFIQALNRDSEDVADAYNRDFSLTGKYKYFFSADYARGFYVEGFGMISNGEYTPDLVYTPNPNMPPVDHSKRYTDFALGFGVGGKFVASGGFFLDLSTGIGRNLLNDNAPTIVGQFNVNLGFRF
ncbi:MAG: hypothetical protein WBV11_01790 [Salegentibacter sp.]